MGAKVYTYYEDMYILLGERASNDLFLSSYVYYIMFVAFNREFLDLFLQVYVEDEDSFNKYGDKYKYSPVQTERDFSRIGRDY